MRDALSLLCQKSSHSSLDYQKRTTRMVNVKIVSGNYWLESLLEPEDLADIH